MDNKIDWDRSLRFLKRGLQLKAWMLTNKRTFCKTTCTVDGCEGMLHVKLVGPKNHGRYYCDTCKQSAME